MKGKSKKQKPKKPKTLSNKVITAVLAFVFASGGYAGYEVIKKDNPDVGYDARLHKVRRVIDGDTIELGDKKRVRLTAIDAPERGACFYSEAKEALENMIEGREVRLEKGLDAVDIYGRLLRYVTLPILDPEADDIFVNYTLVKQGFALRLESTTSSKYRDLLASAEREAKKEKRGMWGECEVVDPKAEAQKLREVDTTPPNPDCTIKGNISEKGYGKNYFMEGCPNYFRVKVDTKKGEQYFCSEKEAQKAGFTRSDSCDQIFKKRSDYKNGSALVVRPNF